MSFVFLPRFVRYQLLSFFDGATSLATRREGGWYIKTGEVSDVAEIWEVQRVSV
jgi:hypothetical protein